LRRAADIARVGTIDLTSGVITPIVTGLKGPGGMAFVDTTKRSAHESDAPQEDGTPCLDGGGDSHGGEAQFASGG
jgi:hypothetical protein